MTQDNGTRLTMLVIVMALTALGAAAQVKINEVFTGAPDAIELRNVAANPIDLGGWEIHAFSSSGDNLPTAEPVFTFPAGTTIAGNGLLVIEEQNGTPTTPPGTIFTGFNYLFTTSRSVEVLLLDDTGRGRDYVLRKLFTTGTSPNKPIATRFAGEFTETGDFIARRRQHDTNNATDWHVADTTSLGFLNPAQFASGNPHERVMISEISWGNPDGMEITNFTGAPVDLTGWRAKVSDGVTISFASSTLDVVIAPGESIVVREPGNPPPLPAGTQDLVRFPALSLAGQDFIVGLFDEQDFVVDHVAVSDIGGSFSNPFSFGPDGDQAIRSGLSGSVGNVSVERVHGMDSNSARDWFEQPDATFGLENTTDGPRSSDFLLGPLPRLVISEVEPGQPDYIELHNAGNNTLNLEDFFLVISSGQGGDRRTIYPFPSRTLMLPGNFIVIGDSSLAPAELPALVQYVDLSQNRLGSQDIPLQNSAPYEIGLYNEFGNLLDLVRASGTASALGHNDPRVPSAPLDFLGTAHRVDAQNLVARTDPAVDTDSGADWRTTTVRTMGSAGGAFVGPQGSVALDARLNSGLGGGLTMILNGGNPGDDFIVLLSFARLNGQGPVFGLGADAIDIFQSFLDQPPLFGTLGPFGSARVFDVEAGSIPPGIVFDMVVLQVDPFVSFILSQTPVLEYDS